MTKNYIYTCVLILLSDQTCLFDKGSLRRYHYSDGCAICLISLFRRDRIDFASTACWHVTLPVGRSPGISS